MRFAQIEFGNASAEFESANSPRLLIDGYLDAANVTTIACEGTSFLFLGYKGAGKTALGQRLKLLAASEPELFVKSFFLADLPYPLFLRLAGGRTRTGMRSPGRGSYWQPFLIHSKATSVLRETQTTSELLPHSTS
jgi:hypothetical protein